MTQRKYRLCSSPGRFLTGRLSDGRQVLMGVCCPHYELYFFNLGGEFTHVEIRELSVPPTIRNGVYFFDSIADTSLEQDVAKWIAELSFTDSAIEINRFAANDTCIEDLPGELMELEEEPQKFAAAERAELFEWKAEWVESGLYAFWWSDELWIDREGSVNTS